MPSNKDQVLLSISDQLTAEIKILLQKRRQVLTGLTGQWAVRKRFLRTIEGVTQIIKAGHIEYLTLWGPWDTTPHLTSNPATLLEAKHQYVSNDFYVYEIVDVNTGEVYDG